MPVWEWSNYIGSVLTMLICCYSPESIKNRSDAFYLVPERSCVPDSPVWYSTQNLSTEAMNKMLHRIRLVREIQEAKYHTQPVYATMWWINGDLTPRCLWRAASGYHSCRQTMNPVYYNGVPKQMLRNGVLWAQTKKDFKPVSKTGIEVFAGTTVNAP